MKKWTAKETTLLINGALNPGYRDGRPVPVDYGALAHVLQTAWDSPAENDARKVRRIVLRTLNRYDLQERFAFVMNGDVLVIHPLARLVPEAREHNDFELKRRYEGKRLVDTRRTVVLDSLKGKDGKPKTACYRPSREYIGRLHGGRTAGAWDSDRMLTHSEGSYVRGTVVRKDGTMRAVGHGFTDLGIQEAQAAYADVDPLAAKKARKLAYAHRRGDSAEVNRLHRM